MSDPKKTFIDKVLSIQPGLAGENDEDKKKFEGLDDEVKGMVKDLKALDSKLTPIAFLNPSNAEPCLADVSLYCELHEEVSKMSPSTYYSLPSLTRYFSHIQSLPPITSARESLLPETPYNLVEFDLDGMPKLERKVVEKEKKVKKEGADSGGGGGGGGEKGEKGGKEKKGKGGEKLKEVPIGEGAGSSSAVSTPAPAATTTTNTTTTTDAPSPTTNENKKQKKQKGEAASAGNNESGGVAEKPAKQAKQPKVVPEVTGPMPSMIDLRVGKILNVQKHPDAESLYVETIDIGEESGPRTVCSGLVAYMSLEQIQDQTVIVVCNLKPVTMRGVKSFAMLLCATSAEGKEGGIEFVKPPAGSQPGERIYFEGEKYENAQPEAQLNPKKKVFETIQPGFVTLDSLEAAWVDPETKSVHKIRTKDGVCKVEKFKGASLS